MKHVRKKFVNRTVLNENIVKVLDNFKPDLAALSKAKEEKFVNQAALIQTKGGELIQSFKYIKDNELFFIAEPNPVVIYFETSRMSYINIAKTKEKLFTELNETYSTLNNFYPFYIHASTCATFLFNSVEAFINGIIPNNFSYSRISKNKTELFDRYQIQFNLPFEEKIKIVIPEITKKSFHKDFGAKYENIIKLKDFRDSIMHTKSDNGKPAKFYEDLYTCALDFNYADTMNHVRDFLNYYEPNLIEDCNCGREF